MAMMMLTMVRGGRFMVVTGIDGMGRGVPAAAARLCGRSVVLPLNSATMGFGKHPLVSHFSHSNEFKFDTHVWEPVLVKCVVLIPLLERKI